MTRYEGRVRFGIERQIPRGALSRARTWDLRARPVGGGDGGALFWARRLPEKEISHAIR